MDNEEIPIAGTPASEPARSSKSSFDRRDPKARAKLLERLPTLAFQDWSIRDDLRFDEDWSAMANLRVDSILEPLEKLATERHRGGT